VYKLVWQVEFGLSRLKYMIDIPMDQWMKQHLRPGASLQKAQLSCVGEKSQKEIDAIFDTLHTEQNMGWAKGPVCCPLPTFVVYKPATKVTPATGKVRNTLCKVDRSSTPAHSTKYWNPGR
jgi:hypothetical protein